MLVLYEASIHKDFERNQVFWITWENVLSFTVLPVVKPEIMEIIIYSFWGLHVFLFCNTKIACTSLYNSLDLLFAFHSLISPS